MIRDNNSFIEDEGLLLDAQLLAPRGHQSDVLRNQIPSQTHHPPAAHTHLSVPTASLSNYLRRCFDTQFINIYANPEQFFPMQHKAET